MSMYVRIRAEVIIKVQDGFDPDTIADQTYMESVCPIVFSDYPFDIDEDVFYSEKEAREAFYLIEKPVAQKKYKKGKK